VNRAICVMEVSTGGITSFNRIPRPHRPSTPLSVSSEPMSHFIAQSEAVLFDDVGFESALGE